MCTLEKGAATVPAPLAAARDDDETQLVDQPAMDGVANLWKTAEQLSVQYGLNPPDFVSCLE